MKPELPKFPTMLRKMWSGIEVQQWIKSKLSIIRSTCSPCVYAGFRVALYALTVCFCTDYVNKSPYKLPATERAFYCPERTDS